MSAGSESRTRILWWIFVAGLAIVVLNAVQSMPQIQSLFLAADGDDQMRMVQVRDWLAGQSWFDSRQYRVLPPDGISMHWSRYVDAGIAAILVPASWLLPQAGAEAAALLLWPSLLAAIMVLAIAQGAGRIFGAAGAIGALAVFFSWSKLSWEFTPPRIDHHSVQILCATAAFYLSLVPGRARLQGVLAGVMTAAALAVGLEMLPTLAAIWGIVSLRHAFGQEGAGDWLVGFGPAFLLAAPLLMIGQTPPSEWLVLHCDELALPVILLGVIGAVATGVPVLAGQVLRGPIARILALVLITGLGVWLAFPVLGQCLSGPYAKVAPEIRAIIENNIIEALSTEALWRSYPDLLARVLLPPVVIAALALPAALHLWPRLDPVQRTALMQAFLVLVVGLLFASLQIRAANLMTPALPLLAGFILWAFTLIPRASLLRLPVLLLLLLALPSVVETAGRLVRRPPPAVSVPAPPKGLTQAERDCRTAPEIARLASLPPAVVFTTINLGPTLLAFTPHAVTSAAYHRSPEAYWYGLGAVETGTGLRAALTDTGADYVALCAVSSLELRFAGLREMLAGTPPDWLVELPDPVGNLRLFKVDKAALARAGGAP